MSHTSHDVNLTQSVLKTLDILDCLASSQQPLSTQEVARQCGLSRPTAYRHLTTLLARDYVATGQDGGRFQIGARVLNLSKSFLDRLDLPDIAKPDMRELSQISKETVYLGILDGIEVLYVGKADSPQQVRMHCVIGTRNPLHCTALGKAILAFLPTEERVALLDQISLTPRTPNTIVDRSALEEDLELVRVRGYAIDDMEIEEGIRCVGTPVFDHTGCVVAAISTSGPAFRLSLARIHDLAQAATRASRAISSKLGYMSDEMPERKRLLGEST